MNPLFYNKQTKDIYLNLDGGLRLIEIDTYKNLFETPFNADNCSQFEDIDSSPLPILKNWPILQDAKLYTSSESSGVYYLKDKYPWADDMDIVYREVEVISGIVSSGFDFSKAVEKDVEGNEVGVPLNLDSNLNVSAIQNLKGYQSIYGYFMFGGRTLNTFFEYLLARFPGHGGSGSNRNRKFRAELKALINYYSQIVNNL